MIGSQKFAMSVDAGLTFVDGDDSPSQQQSPEHLIVISLNDQQQEEEEEVIYASFTDFFGQN